MKLLVIATVVAAAFSMPTTYKVIEDTHSTDGQNFGEESIFIKASDFTDRKNQFSSREITSDDLNVNFDYFDVQKIHSLETNSDDETKNFDDHHEIIDEILDDIVNGQLFDTIFKDESSKDSKEEHGILHGDSGANKENQFKNIIDFLSANQAVVSTEENSSPGIILKDKINHVNDDIETDNNNKHSEEKVDADDSPKTRIILDASFDEILNGGKSFGTEITIKDNSDSNSQISNDAPEPLDLNTNQIQQKSTLDQLSKENDSSAERVIIIDTIIPSEVFTDQSNDEGFFKSNDKTTQINLEVNTAREVQKKDTFAQHSDDETKPAEGRTKLGKTLNQKSEPEFITQSLDKSILREESQKEEEKEHTKILDSHLLENSHIGELEAEEAIAKAQNNQKELTPENVEEMDGFDNNVADPKVEENLGSSLIGDKIPAEKTASALPEVTATEESFQGNLHQEVKQEDIVEKSVIDESSIPESGDEDSASENNVHLLEDQSTQAKNSENDNAKEEGNEVLDNVAVENTDLTVPLESKDAISGDNVSQQNEEKEEDNVVNNFSVDKTSVVVSDKTSADRAGDHRFEEDKRKGKNLRDDVSGFNEHSTQEISVGEKDDDLVSIDKATPTQPQVTNDDASSGHGSPQKEESSGVEQKAFDHDIDTENKELDLVPAENTSAKLSPVAPDDISTHKNPEQKEEKEDHVTDDKPEHESSNLSEKAETTKEIKSDNHLEGELGSVPSGDDEISIQHDAQLQEKQDNSGLNKISKDNSPNHLEGELGSVPSGDDEISTKHDTQFQEKQDNNGLDKISKDNSPNHLEGDLGSVPSGDDEISTQHDTELQEKQDNNGLDKISKDNSPKPVGDTEDTEKVDEEKILDGVFPHIDFDKVPTDKIAPPLTNDNIDGVNINGYSKKEIMEDSFKKEHVDANGELFKIISDETPFADSSEKTKDLSYQTSKTHVVTDSKESQQKIEDLSVEEPSTIHLSKDKDSTSEEYNRIFETKEEKIKVFDTVPTDKTSSSLFISVNSKDNIDALSRESEETQNRSPAKDETHIDIGRENLGAAIEESLPPKQFDYGKKITSSEKDKESAEHSIFVISGPSTSSEDQIIGLSVEDISGIEQKSSEVQSVESSDLALVDLDETPLEQSRKEADRSNEEDDQVSQDSFEKGDRKLISDVGKFGLKQVYKQVKQVKDFDEHKDEISTRESVEKSDETYISPLRFGYNQVPMQVKDINDVADYYELIKERQTPEKSYSRVVVKAKKLDSHSPEKDFHERGPLKYGDKLAYIVHEERGFDANGNYFFKFETSDGTKRQESGKRLDSNKGPIAQEGEYSYILPTGEDFYLSYVANEHGFQPQSDWLPVAPEFPHPIPTFVLKQIEKAELEVEQRKDSSEEALSHTQAYYV